ncbi:hypothetical protein C8F01DRAFT_1158820 [Mycena amicta]|nr:hypothetical protein C8F01DRAFT_1158820 [Mycena amicta]
MLGFKLPVLTASALVTLAAGSIVNGTGTVFQITPGIGACGFTNTSTQAVATVSNTTFNFLFPGATPKNSNKNPICHHTLLVHVPNMFAALRFQVVDYFPEGKHAGRNDVGIPLYYFDQVAPESDGVIENVFWEIV